MSLSYNATEINLVIALFRKLRSQSEEESYLYKLAKEVEKTVPTTLENLEKLEYKGVVRAKPTHIPRGTRGPVRLYYLTSFGERLAQVLSENKNIMRQLAKKIV